MLKDILIYEGKKYQLSGVKINGCFETMIFPIIDGVVSDIEVYCFRTTEVYKFHNKYRDIYYHPKKYVSKEAITKYLKEKEEYFKPMKNVLAEDVIYGKIDKTRRKTHCSYR